MAPSNTTQDDYYAQVQSSAGGSNNDSKKPLKLKIKKKVEDDVVTETQTFSPDAEAPRARVVQREHAWDWLFRSAIKGKSDSSDEKDTTRKPLISFKKVDNQVKVLENRPVMQLPDERRRSSTPRSNPLHRPPSSNSPNQYARPKSTTPSTTSDPSRGTRMRDDSKPIFQRDISFATPMKDGTAKKKKDRNAKDYTADGGKKWVKVIGWVADDGTFRRGHKISKKQQKSLDDIKQVLVDRTGQEVAIPDFISVKEFSDKIGVAIPKIMGEMMKNGMLVSLNAQVDYDTCYLIGESFGIKIIKEISEDVSVADLMDGNIEEMIKEDDPSRLVERSPIISIMGHVDHGKTSILDFIRKSSVASWEAGGITQKIWAYQVEKNGKKITFLDTPGHEAFTIMRARGAKLTDIAIIVVAADEGMKPQTIESIAHAREAWVPMIVAANKMDKPGANLDIIRWQMAEHGLQPEEWGGDVVLVPVSAHTGLGMEALLEMILLQSEILELKANPDRPAVATVVEAHLDQKLGSVATILINAGTIRKGENIVCGTAFGKVRTLKDYKWKNTDEAGPGVPVQITGLSEVVQGGDILQVVSTPLIATERAKEYTLAKNKKSIHAFEWASLGMLMSRLKSGALKQLKIVLKCDSNGSLEALKAALLKLSTPETQVVFIHAAAGDVNESDVMMAGTSQALLIAYNVWVVPSARQTLQNSKIEFIDKKVIYHVLEKVEAIITGMIDIRFDDVDIGISTVKAIFFTGKNNSMMIVGMGVDSGKVENRAKIRVIREGKKVGSWEVVNLKSWVLDVGEIEEGNDCGINFKGDVQILVGDTLEFYKLVQRK
jgi:translation initiation factor IF-2